ncbi:PREDICTED: uncharacterized protein LOC109175926 [Ipomoea nil]|uniref:uncharacterized protein LOC109175926 n=1 Tax=Ipomoea nil TaxID=35883 RepID=UPI000901FBF3|nr:PREDICTED: uncharacterized protein LOC109175926 [Ipomoea nil]
MLSRELSCNNHLSSMLHVLRRRFRRLFSRLRLVMWRRTGPRVIIRRFGKLNPRRTSRSSTHSKPAVPKSSALSTAFARPIRLATFNAALFTLAPAVPKTEKSSIFAHDTEDCFKIEPANSHPKSILKRSPLHPILNDTDDDEEFDFPKLTKPKPRVSINLPENEISLAHNKVFSMVPVRSPICFPAMASWLNLDDGGLSGSRTILDVLKEVDADVLALQDVKAEEEKDMKPLSDLARALGMNYVFAESWAPEYGNAILSKWPIKKWRVQKICDDKDFRNVLKATIDVPKAGELNFYSTQLDHLDENWRMKQINAMIQSNDHPHILAGGLNSLDGSDYSAERWTDVVKYYEEIGKPTPKLEVMNFLKGKEYADAKHFAGECEPAVIIAKGQNVQGTCKYGTRVDYILGSQGLPYMFVPGSYSVVSSKGTSDHHIVKVDIMKLPNSGEKNNRKHKKLQQRVEKITTSCSPKGYWELSI